ncbi:hypothetical protein HDK90DRAFT_295897 [Phyllosticta capitalensis]|uniref:Uncharacterized protein n=1 Tax=Phyllosticta capitalensis TaxID=121624 RepID=A0ABR1YJU1_9PEZI
MAALGFVSVFFEYSLLLLLLLSRSSIHYHTTHPSKPSIHPSINSINRRNGIQIQAHPPSQPHPSNRPSQAPTNTPAKLATCPCPPSNRPVPPHTTASRQCRRRARRRRRLAANSPNVPSTTKNHTKSRNAADTSAKQESGQTVAPTRESNLTMPKARVVVEQRKGKELASSRVWLAAFGERRSALTHRLGVDDVTCVLSLASTCFGVVARLSCRSTWSLPPLHSAVPRWEGGRRREGGREGARVMCVGGECSGGSWVGPCGVGVGWWSRSSRTSTRRMMRMDDGIEGEERSGVDDRTRKDEVEEERERAKESDEEQPRPHLTFKAHLPTNNPSSRRHKLTGPSIPNADIIQSPQLALDIC